MKFLTSLAPRVLWTLLAAFVLLVTGCDLEGENDDGGAEVVTAGVYVANAGAFQGNNSSYTVYDPQRTTAELVDLSALGSYVQSLLVADSLVYVLMGETGAVEVFSAATNERVGRIEGIPNPRYMALAGPDRAYVTSQDYSGSPGPRGRRRSLYECPYRDRGGRHARGRRRGRTGGRTWPSAASAAAARWP